MRLLQDTTAEIEIKKSRFLCFLHRTDSVQESADWLKALKKQHPGARHFCTACRIGDIVRSNDDGEPSGTAGRPMLQVLEGADLEDVFCVVIRYFGGTLLGTGGLVRAYSGAVRQALSQAVLTTSRTVCLYHLDIPYALSGRMESLLLQHSVLEREYGQEIHVQVAVDEENEEEFLQAAAAVSSGKIVPVYAGTSEVEMPAVGK